MIGVKRYLQPGLMMRDVIRFRFSPVKARATIQFLLNGCARMDLHALLKSCYFADKAHLNKHHRPILGATYRAMKFGPVPLEVYEMVKGESIWLAELESESFPWRVEGYHVSPTCSDAVQNLSVLSETDHFELAKAKEKSLGMTFTERTLATHGPDWQAANLGIMKYEDMIDDSPKKPELVAYLREAGPFMRL